MSSFTSPLWVTPLDNGRDWQLIRSFVYHLGSKSSRMVVKVPKGFVTDFASVPRLFFFLPDWATYSKAPVLHDWLYTTKEIKGVSITRSRADKIFLEAMFVDWRHKRSRYIIAVMEYLAVVLFAWPAWKNKLLFQDERC